MQRIPCIPALTWNLPERTFGWLGVLPAGHQRVAVLRAVQHAAGLVRYKIGHQAMPENRGKKHEAPAKDVFFPLPWELGSVLFQADIDDLSQWLRGGLQSCPWIPLDATQVQRWLEFPLPSKIGGFLQNLMALLLFEVDFVHQCHTLAWPLLRELQDPPTFSESSGKISRRAQAPFGASHIRSLAFSRFP